MSATTLRSAAQWTAVIVNYNGATYLPACIEAIQRSTHPPADIIVVDNASSDDSLQELHAYPRVQVAAQLSNLGFAGGANAGLALVETPLALLLNPDVEIEPAFGDALQAVFAADPSLGAAGALLLYPETDRIQHAGGVIESPLCTTRHRGYGEPRSAAWEVSADCDFVTGGALGLRMEAFRAVGGFDEGYAPVYYEDVDLCVRLRAAHWRVQYRPELVAQHHEGVTLQQSAQYHRFLHRNRLRFAVQHLDAARWNAFVAAEHTRLQYALAATLPTDADWADITGVSSIEDQLRLTGDGASLHAAETARAEMTRVVNWADSLHSPTAGMRPLGRLRRILQRIVVGDMAGHASRQDAFNASVVAALRTQEAVQREQIATTLLLLLQIAYRMERGGASATTASADAPTA